MNQIRPESPRVGRRGGLTLIELMATLGVILLLMAVVLPAVSYARVRGQSASSMENLRRLGAAHFVYAVDFDGRQLQFIVDDAAAYGDYGSWWREYAEQHGSDGSWGDPGNAPSLELGWGRIGDRFTFFQYETSQSANVGLVVPINWSAPGTIGIEFFGSFRFPNAAQFHQYLEGRFYDRVFYAPADELPIDAIGVGFDDPDEYWNGADVSGPGSIPAWSSYCLSPAAMFNPEVMRHDDPDDENANGWREPFTFDEGFLSPSLAQFRYPALKTHMLEHNWLQNAPTSCNPAFDPGTYDGCEPFYFNHGRASVPMTLFYDGHVEGVHVERAMGDDAAVRAMTGHDNWGLWSKDTLWGEDGYLSDYGFDALTSFHILTTDGAEGRDVLSPGAASSWKRPVGAADRVKRRGRRPAAPVSADVAVSRMLEPGDD